MRLIDADALLYELEIVPLTGDGGVDANDLDDIIKRQPTIEERKTGRWEQVEVSYLTDMDAGIKESMAIASMFCPNCKRYHNEVYLYGNPTYGINYCPNCGAKMENKT